jgi:hypothetical protein
VCLERQKVLYRQYYLGNLMDLLVLEHLEVLEHQMWYYLERLEILVVLWFLWFLEVLEHQQHLALLLHLVLQ